MNVSVIINGLLCVALYNILYFIMLTTHIDIEVVIGSIGIGI